MKFSGRDGVITIVFSLFALGASMNGDVTGVAAFTGLTVFWAFGPSLQ